MSKVELTDKFLQAAKPAPKGARTDWMDTVVLKFGVRVTDKADDKGRATSRTFILVDRFPGEKNQTRKTIGSYPAMSLKEGRDTARKWLEQIQMGIHPINAEAERKAAEDKEQRRAAEAEIEAQRRAEEEKLAQEVLLFRKIAEAFIDHIKAVGQRRAGTVEKEIRRELIPVWGHKLATEITDEDIKSLLKDMRFGKDRKRPAPTQVFNTFDNIRAIFNWALDEDAYKKLGLRHSPCDRIKRARVLGKKKIGQRVLTDDELFAYMRNARRGRYPWGPRFLALAYTGGRISEVTACEWPEFDLRKKLWTIPPERFKSDVAHIIPLADDFVELLRSLPRFKGGSFVFTTTAGESPVWDNSTQKGTLNQRMLRTLKALAKLRGDDPGCVKLPNFTNHDIRRACRTRLSALRIEEKVAELAIGHGEKDPVKRAYDLHRYQDELREAFDAWAKLLRDIAMPQPANVVAMPSRARA